MNNIFTSCLFNMNFKAPSYQTLHHHSIYVPLGFPIIFLFAFTVLRASRNLFLYFISWQNMPSDLKFIAFLFKLLGTSTLKFMG